MTPKQRTFCIEYLQDANATQAAIRAGYSPRSARTAGARLLANDDIHIFLEQARGKAQAAATLDLQETLRLLSSIATDPVESSRNKIHAISVLAKLNGWEKQAGTLNTNPVVLTVVYEDRD